jgi:uncharacterized membrane protein|nr:MAG: membrane-associated transcriptional regulator [Thermoproteus sp. AZ2]
MIWAILLFANGTAVLVFNQTVTANIFSVQLPTQPLSIPLVELNKTPVPAVLNGTSLQVPVLGTALVTIVYVPKVEAAGGLLYFNVSEGQYVVWAQGGVIVLPAVKVLNLTKINGSLLAFVEGPGQIAYALQGSIASAPTTSTSSAGTQTTTTSSTIATSSTTTEGSATPPTTSSAGFSPPAIYGSVAAVAAVVAVFALLARRQGPAELNETDKAILTYLKRHGGAYEAEIARDLGIPRTTVFKAVRRLEERGLVKVEKRDGRNYVEAT